MIQTHSFFNMKIRNVVDSQNCGSPKPITLAIKEAFSKQHILLKRI